MTLRNFPPADQCDPEDLDNLADLVVRDPRASYDLAGSREHIEALCRRYQSLAFARKNLTERMEFFATRMEEFREERDEAQRAALTLQRDLAAATNDLDAARTEIRALASTLDHERNERQAEVLDLGAQRERADEAEAAAEVFEVTARAALAILARDRGREPTEPVKLSEIVHAVDGRLSRALVRMITHDAMQSVRLENALRQLAEHRQTLHHNDRIQSALAATCEAVTGKPIEQVNLELDEELAAHPEMGPLHHARDQRDYQEDMP